MMCVNIGRTGEKEIRFAGAHFGFIECATGDLYDGVAFVTPRAPKSEPDGESCRI